MRRPTAISAAILALFSTSALPAKDPVLRITVSGGGLAKAIEITNPNVISMFNIGAGPGNFRYSGSERIPIVIPQGFIVDWTQELTAPPNGPEAYEISFLTTRADHNTYKVRYVLDPVSNQGYVYIPGESDAAYADNVSIIWRGVEGKWFRAWSVWEQVVHPLIAQAGKTPRP